MRSGAWPFPIRLWISVPLALHGGRITKTKPGRQAELYCFLPLDGRIVQFIYCVHSREAGMNRMDIYRRDICYVDHAYF